MVLHQRGLTENAKDLMVCVSNLYKQQQCFDIQLVTEENAVYHLHKIVLLAFSRFFQKLVEKDLGKKYVVSNTDGKTLEALIEFMYTGELNVTKTNVSRLLSTAIQLEITPAVDILSECYQQLKGKPIKNAPDVNQDSVIPFVESVSPLKALNAAGSPKKIKKKRGRPKKTRPPDLNSQEAPKIDHVKQEIIDEAYDKVNAEANNTDAEQPCDQSFSQQASTIKEDKDDREQVPDIDENGGTCESGETSGNDDEWTPQAKHKVPKMKTIKIKRTKSDDPEYSIQPAEQSILGQEVKVEKRRRGRPRKSESTITEYTEYPNQSVEQSVLGQEVIIGRRRRGRPRKSESTIREQVKPKEKHYLCTQCDQQFVHNAALTLHKRVHLKNKARKLATLDRCKLMGHILNLKIQNSCKRFTKRQISKQHDGSKYQCKVCEATFCRFTEYQQHFSQKHKRWMKCRKCKRTCTSHKLLKVHMMRIHTKGQLKFVKNKSNFNCQSCGKQFLYERNFKQHEDICHSSSTGKLYMVCRHCGRTFKYTAALKAHLSHHGLTPEEILVEETKPDLLPVKGNVYPRQKTQSKWAAEQKTNSELMKCEICSRDFSTLHTLNLHMLQKHNSPLYTPKAMAKPAGVVWRCEEMDCDFQGRTATDLNNHIQANHPDIHFACAHCKYKTHVRTLFEKHIQTRHDSSSNKGKKCPQCTAQFKSYYHVKVHLYYKHNYLDPTLKIHRCPQEGCDYFSFQRYIVDMHMSRHSKAKNFTCPICDKKFKKEKNVQKHVDKVHKGIRPYICDLCGAAYAEESELKTHMARHSKEKQYKCAECGYATSDKGNFNSHMWCRHKIRMNAKMKIYKCEECDYTCDRITRFHEHMTVHRGERNFTCQECGKSFLKKNTLRGHILWVHKEKTVKCDYCDHVTSTVANLREHVRIMHTHRNIKPFKCAYCDYHCLTAGNCRKHVAVRHKDLPIKIIKVCEKYPDGIKPDLRAERYQNPHRPQTVASFDYNVEALMEGSKPKDTNATGEESVTQHVPTPQQEVGGNTHSEQDMLNIYPATTIIETSHDIVNQSVFSAGEVLSVPVGIPSATSELDMSSIPEFHSGDIKHHEQHREVLVTTGGQHIGVLPGAYTWVQGASHPPTDYHVYNPGAKSANNDPHAL